MVGKQQHPLAPRIKRLMQSDEDVGKISQLTPSLVACAVDQLVKQLCRGAADLARDRGVKTVTPPLLKAYIESQPKLDFLRDIVADIAAPEPVSPRAAKRPRLNKAAPTDQSSEAPAPSKARQKAKRAAAPPKLEGGSDVKAEHPETFAQTAIQSTKAEETDTGMIAPPDNTGDSPQAFHGTAPASHVCSSPGCETADGGSTAAVGQPPEPNTDTGPSSTAAQPESGAVPVMASLPVSAHAAFEEEDDYDAD